MFSKRVFLLLIAFLIIMNIAIRYPDTPHETGVDSFFVHSLSNSISQEGYAKWVLHPLSFFGLFPSSYPSGVPFILSALSQVIGLDTEFSILLLSSLTGLLALFTSLILAFEVCRDRMFAFIVAFAFSTAPIFLADTIWTASTRYIMLALSPIFLWSLIKGYRCEKNAFKYTALAVVLFMVIALIHRMAYLLFILLIIYLLALILSAFRDKGIIKKISKQARLALLLALFIITFALLFLPINAFGIEGAPIGVYEKGSILEGREFYVLALNVFISTGSGAGVIASIFAVLGFFLILQRGLKEPIDVFLIFALLLIIILLPLRTYVRPFAPLFISIVAGLGFLQVFRLIKDRRRAISLLIASLLISLAFSSFMVEHWRSQNIGRGDDEHWMSQESYDTALYLRDCSGNRFFVSNNWILAQRVQAVSEIPTLPVVGGSPCYINMAIYRNLTLGEVNATPLSLQEISPNSDYLFSSAVEMNINKDYVRLMRAEYSSSDARELINYYQIDYVLKDNSYLKKYAGWHSLNFYDSLFIETISQYEYKIYDNGKESIYLV